MEEILHARMADAHGGETAKWNVDPTAHGIYAEPQGEAKEAQKEAKARELDLNVVLVAGCWLLVVVVGFCGCCC